MRRARARDCLGTRIVPGAWHVRADHGITHRAGFGRLSQSDAIIVRGMCYALQGVCGAGSTALLRYCATAPPRLFEEGRQRVTTQEERQAYIDDMARRRGYVLSYHKGMAQADFEVLKAADALIAAVYTTPRHLDRKTKELLFCATLTVMRAGKGQLQSHIRAALQHGASVEEVLEAIEIALPEAGVVAFQAGFEAWREVAGVEGIEPRLQVFDGGDGVR
jgi:4-carboxymuconolactone decarboxylase